MFYLPAVLIFSYNVSIYVFLARQVHGTELGANIRKRVLLYLLVFSICAVWGLVHRIYQLFSKDHQPLIQLSYLESKKYTTLLKHILQAAPTHLVLQWYLFVDQFFVWPSFLADLFLD